MKAGRSDTSSSPDENKNPSKGLFRKIFKKKSNNLSFHVPEESKDEPIIRRSRTISEISRPVSVFGQIDYSEFLNLISLLVRHFSPNGKNPDAFSTT
jgi:hypothetical protein